MIPVPPGHRITADGIRLPQHGPPVCVLTPNRKTPSETFIQGLVESLPATVELVYGGCETRAATNKPIAPLWVRGACFAARRLKLRSAADAMRIWSLERFLRDFGIRVALAEYGPVGLYVLESALRAGVPLVVRFHGFDAYHQGTLEGAGRSYPRLFRHCAAIVAVSQDMARQLVALGAPREKVHAIPCGVDTRIFEGGRPDAAPPHFVFVGRLVPKKAPLLALQAFRKVLDACPEARLRMLGEGELMQACLHSVSALGMGHAVDLPGACTPQAVLAALRAARAFVLPSMRAQGGDSEGTPVSILEASSVGLPVVSTRHGGIPDAVQDGRTGFLAEEGDVSGLADRMIELARRSDLAASLGACGREHMRSTYPHDRCVRRMWEVLEGAMEETRC